MSINRDALIGGAVRKLTGLSESKLALVVCLLERLALPDSKNLERGLEKCLIADTDKTNTPAPATPPPAEISLREREELKQQVEMFEVIVADAPNDYQSLEILKNAYARLGRKEETLATWRKIAIAYMALGGRQDAQQVIAEILAQHPNDAGTLTLLAELNRRISPS